MWEPWGICFFWGGLGRPNVSKSSEYLKFAKSGKKSKKNKYFFINKLNYYNHSVIILLEGAGLHNKIGRNWCKFSRPKCATSQHDISLETARSLANGPSAGGWGAITRELQRFLSFIVYGNTGGVWGRSLTAGKILFTGRQTWSLYLVLWLCDYNLLLQKEWSWLLFFQTKVKLWMVRQFWLQSA